MIPQLRQFTNLAPIRDGYALDDVFSVVVPSVRTNLVTNPSFELATTSWAGIFTATVARTTTQQYHGAYSLLVTPSTTTNDGALFSNVSLTSGTTYAYSIKFKGQAGLKYLLNLESLAGVAVASTSFTA